MIEKTEKIKTCKSDPITNKLKAVLKKEFTQPSVKEESKAGTCTIKTDQNAMIVLSVVPDGLETQMLHIYSGSTKLWQEALLVDGQPAEICKAWTPHFIWPQDKADFHSVLSEMAEILGANNEFTFEF